MKAKLLIMLLACGLLSACAGGPYSCQNTDPYCDGSPGCLGQCRCVDDFGNPGAYSPGGCNTCDYY